MKFFQIFKRPKHSAFITLDRSVARAQIAAFSNHKLPTGVILSGSPQDGMLLGDTHSHYLGVGISALTAIQSAATLWSIAPFKTIMDFGCGHGRVLRWLRAAYPEAEIIGSDIDQDGVAFCASQLGSKPLQSFVDIDQIQPGRSFDLIFAGSVITHLPEKSSVALIERFIDWLNPGGIAVFSAHGATAVAAQQRATMDYTLGGNGALALAGYDQSGYGYADYPGQNGYGVSFTRPTWFCDLLSSMPEVENFAVIERAWDHHHDMIALKRR